MAAHTVSVCKGRGSLAHNNREFATPNVDQSRTNLNIVYKQEPLPVAYDKIFGEELARYNAAQKRADRKIPDYMEHIRNSKNGEKLFYETVVQIGNKHTCNAITQNGELAAKILDEYMKDFQNRNPNLYVFNAVLHLDEQTPHLHIDYIPVAREYKQGLQIRNSLDKALKQQGIDGKGGKKDNSTQRWQESEKKALGEVMERHGWQRAAESGIKREKMTVSQYKATMSEIEHHVSTLPEQIERKSVPLSKDKVIVSAEELDALELRAKLSIVHEEAQQAVQEKMDDKVAQVDDYVNQRLTQLQMQQAEVERKRRIAEEMNTKAIRESNAAKAQMVKYESLYRQQYFINDTVKALEAENTSLKAENASLRGQIAQKVEEAVKPLKEQLAALTDKMRNMALGQATLIKAIKYVAVFFSGEVSKAILEAAHQQGNKWLKDDGFEDMVSDNTSLAKSISRNIRMPLTFKDGEEGRGVYSPKGTCVMNCDTIKEARERFPNSQIKNLTRSRDEWTI